jgi:hypothetical protein
MAGSKSDVYEVDVLKATTGQATTILTTTPLTAYIALFTVAPSDSSGGTEVTGGSYARVSSAGKWATPSAGSVATNAAITFATASAGWGTVVAFAVMSASSGGSVLMWGDLTVSKAVNNGDTASFASGAITLTED